MGERICSVEDCDRPANVPGSAKGFCGKHYQRWKRHGDVHYIKPRNVGVAPCSIEGCPRLVKARGWCAKHLTRWDRYGDALARMPGEIVDGCRICPRCETDKPLTEWSKGYCRSCQAAIVAAHRLTNPEPGWRHAAMRRARILGAPIETFDRIEIFERDGWVCQICKLAVERREPWRGPKSPTLDHIVPLSRGGAHSRANAQTACFSCNMHKGSRLIA